MRTVACPNCGAPQTDAPSDRAFHCTFCGKRIEPDLQPQAPARVAPSPWLDDPQPPSPSANRGPGVIIGLAVGLIMAAGAVGFFLVGSRGTGTVASPPTIQGPLVTADSGTTSADGGAVAAAASADVERNPITIIWHARVRAATGDKPLAPGTPCTLTQVVVHGDRPNSNSTKLLTFECQGRMLYDSAVQLEGMASESDELDEEPVPGELLAFQYATKQQDIGTRSGDRNQITASTRDDFVEAFRDTPPTFHVKATVELLSAARKGKPLRDFDAPNFPDVLRRTATVTSRVGAVPFAVKTCDLAISPAGSRDENCRVLLTCGGKVVFGGGTVGWEKCAMDHGEPVSLVDPYPTPKDHDPELSVDLASATATLGDTLPSGAQYTVGFSLASK